MSRRAIIECDRCRREITAVAATVNIGGEKELCKGCKRDLDQFMQNTQLEEPP